MTSKVVLLQMITMYILMKYSKVTKKCKKGPYLSLTTLSLQVSLVVLLEAHSAGVSVGQQLKVSLKCNTLEIIFNRIPLLNICSCPNAHFHYLPLIAPPIADLSRPPVPSCQMNDPWGQGVQKTWPIPIITCK